MEAITVMVVDGGGGGLGRALIEKLKKGGINAKIIAVGTNAAATAAMLKGGADEAATGENAAVFNAPAAGIIAGGVGIIAANAMLGEITPAMANALASARCRKILIPVNRCDIHIAGMPDISLSERIEAAANEIRASARG